MAESQNSAVAADKIAEVWFEKNWKKVLTVIILVLVVGMAVFAVAHQRAQKTEKAIRSLAEAKVGDLPALLEKSAGIPGAAAARMRLADDLVAKKDYAAAAKQFALVADDASAFAETCTLAKLSAAGCLELAGGKKEAAEAYLKIMNDSAASVNARNEAGFQAGRIFAAIGDARAKEVLSKVASSPAVQGGTPWQNNAAVLLKTLQ